VTDADIHAAADGLSTAIGVVIRYTVETRR